MCRAVGVILVGSLLGIRSYAGQPKLVVGIVVDGLRQEILDQIRPHLTADGFNRFFNSGVVFNNVDFGTNIDATASTAVIMTGSSPAVNGISGEFVYDPEGRRIVEILTDEKFGGNNTDKRVSPNALQVTTTSDEARIAGAGVTYVYAIAPTASQALILASHAGNSGVWFNENTGKWAWSSYYKEVPQYVLNDNRTNRLVNRIDTMQWQPSSKTAVAASLPNHLKQYPFRYTFAGKGPDKFRRFAGSPLLNNEISGLAEQYVRGLDLGKHDGTDVLNLAFTLQPYNYSKTPENRYETYDSYVKLDSSLAQLFETIDKTVGRDNVVIYLAGTPQRSNRRKDDDKWNIPSGEFSSRRAASLLNLYLIALNGNGEWVKAFHNNNFYLNADLANTLDKDINVLRQQAVDCLIRMSGVGHAYTIDDVVSTAANVPNAKAKAQNTVIGHAGDVMIELVPGWSLVDDFNFPGAYSAEATSLSPATASFMISAPGVSSQIVETPVDARIIAPTVNGLLHIRSPNGAELPAIRLK